MISGSDRKNWQNSTIQWKKTVSEKNHEVTTQEKGEVEVGTLLLGNAKHNVIANKVLSYF